MLKSLGAERRGGVGIGKDAGLRTHLNRLFTFQANDDMKSVAFWAVR
jgi:hypothetical protein